MKDKLKFKECENCEDWIDIVDCMNICGKPLDALDEFNQYREIGTVEECREAREKQRAKKPHITTHIAIDADTKEEIKYHLQHCPFCFSNKEIPYFGSLLDKGTSYCHRCGQAIDWSE